MGACDLEARKAEQARRRAEFERNVVPTSVGRMDRGGEWLCPHGIGHYLSGTAHSCDGCCGTNEDFKRYARGAK